MKALLLSAGLGTRLRPITNDKPKCMVEVAGKPILLRNIEWLRGHGVGEFVVNLHYRPEAVTSSLGDGSRFGVRVDYSFEPFLRGTAGAVAAAAHLLLPAPFLVVYADNLIKCDIARLCRAHEEGRSILTVALFFRDDVSASGAVVLDEADRIVSFSEKSGRVEAGWVNAGALLCGDGVVDHIPSAGVADFGSEVIPELVRSGAIVRGYRMSTQESLRWIDTPEDLARTEAELVREQA